MNNYIETYEKISKEILGILNNSDLENDDLDKCFEKRQQIINEIEQKNNLDEFKIIYKEKLLSVDEEIKALFQVKLIETKKEIMEYKKKQNVNNNYTAMNKINLNIFSKKV